MAGQTSPAARKWRVGDLLGSAIVDVHGHVLGHVADIQISRQPPYEVQGLLYGERGWSHRLHLSLPSPRGRSRPTAGFIPWSAVARLETGRVHLKA
ncbi:MAG TPA: hypothetical protein VHD63_02220 [Ktedonobacteraceae bacterium]|nr:hypothetical protein [Ktedonobacteraceae bacterium]